MNRNGLALVSSIRPAEYNPAAFCGTAMERGCSQVYLRMLYDTKDILRVSCSLSKIATTPHGSDGIQASREGIYTLRYEPCEGDMGVHQIIPTIPGHRLERINALAPYDHQQRVIAAFLLSNVGFFSQFASQVGDPRFPWDIRTELYCDNDHIQDATPAELQGLSKGLREHPLFPQDALALDAMLAAFDAEGMLPAQRAPYLRLVE